MTVASDHCEVPFLAIIARIDCDGCKGFLPDGIVNVLRSKAHAAGDIYENGPVDRALVETEHHTIGDVPMHKARCTDKGAFGGFRTANAIGHFGFSHFHAAPDLRAVGFAVMGFMGFHVMGFMGFRGRAGGGEREVESFFQSLHGLDGAGAASGRIDRSYRAGKVRIFSVIHADADFT